MSEPGTVRCTWSWFPAHVESRPWGNPFVGVRHGIHWGLVRSECDVFAPGELPFLGSTVFPLYTSAHGGGRRRVVGVAAARTGRYASGGERDWVFCGVQSVTHGMSVFTGFRVLRSTNRMLFNWLSNRSFKDSYGNVDVIRTRLLNINADFWF